MGLPGPDGTISLYVVTSLAAAPAVSLGSDIASAVDITYDIMSDGMPDFPESGQLTNIADASSGFRKQDIGTYGGDSGSFTVKYDSDPTLRIAAPVLGRGTRGLFIFAEGGGTGAGAADVNGNPVQYNLLAVGDEVTVIRFAVSTLARVAVTTNMPARRKCDFAITSTPYTTQIVI